MTRASTATPAKKPAPAKATAVKKTPAKAALVKKAPAKTTPTSSTAARSLDEIALDKIKANPANLRRALRNIDELAQSIEAVGILESLIVRPGSKAGEYELVAGHRRLVAAKKAKLKTAPCEIRVLSDVDVAEMMLIENLQRDDLDPLEEADGFNTLHTSGMTQTVIAKRVGCTQAHVSRRLALLKLPDTARTTLAAEKLTIEDALDLTKIADEPDVVTMIVTETLKAKSTGHYSPNVGALVERHKRDLETAAKVTELTAEHEAKGLKVLPPTAKVNYDQRLEYGNSLPGITLAQHKKEPCHAIYLDVTYGNVRAVPVCTDLKRHGKTGASEFKTTKATAHERAEEQLTPGQRAEREARDLRREFIRRALGPTMSVDDGLVDRLALRRYLADANHDECRRIGELLELDPILNERAQGGKSWGETVAAYATTSHANLRRACLAFAIVQGEWGYGVKFGDHLQILIALGHEPKPVEEKLVAPGTDGLEQLMSDPCRVCGCTTLAACEGGCHWVPEDCTDACDHYDPDTTLGWICSTCATKKDTDAQPPTDGETTAASPSDERNASAPMLSVCGHCEAPVMFDMAVGKHGGFRHVDETIEHDDPITAKSAALEEATA